MQTAGRGQRHRNLHASRVNRRLFARSVRLYDPFLQVLECGVNEEISFTIARSQRFNAYSKYVDQSIGFVKIFVDAGVELWEEDGNSSPNIKFETV
jgi:hypothetical protein